MNQSVQMSDAVKQNQLVLHLGLLLEEEDRLLVEQEQDPWVVTYFWIWCYQGGSHGG